MQELQQDHLGIVKMKSVARLHCWWPGILTVILRTWADPAETVKERESPHLSAYYIHGFGHHNQCNEYIWILLVHIWVAFVDAHSKWVDAIPMKTTASIETIAVLRNIFATHGLPVQVVTDNGPQFISDEFAEFVEQNGIKHVHSLPYHPASIGQAKRVIQILKSKLKAMKDDEPSWFSILQSVKIFTVVPLNTSFNHGGIPSGVIHWAKVKDKTILIEASSGQ